MDPIERAVRALCRYNNILIDTRVDGAPAWHACRSEGTTLIAACAAETKRREACGLRPSAKRAR